MDMLDLTSEFGRKVEHYLHTQDVIWFTTLGLDLTPQPRPVWFVWDGATFLIYSQPDHKVRHVTRHPRVALNFNTDHETGDTDVIVFTGAAAIDPSAPAAHKMQAYFEKYREGIAGLKMTPEEYGEKYSVAIRVTPARVRGW
jgi:PPOX class probable F420-dependent enzyme